VATWCTRQAHDSTVVDAFVQPWWIHAPLDEGESPRPGQDPRCEFAAMATRLTLAAWMFGIAVASSFVTVAPTPGAASAVAHAMERVTSGSTVNVSALQLPPPPAVDAWGRPVSNHAR
jgi:hypothetical protein